MGSNCGKDILGKLAQKSIKIPKLRFFEENSGREWELFESGSQSLRLRESLILIYFLINYAILQN